MAARHEGPALDENSILWRFMDFKKFESMLQHRGLYLSRSDRLGDDFEGARSLRYDWTKHPPPGSEFDWIREDQKILEMSYQHLKRWTYISCWHCNPQETGSMWGKYTTPGGGGLALNSTVHRLGALLDETCVVGLCSYVDYSKDEIPEELLFLHKQTCHHDDKEVRAIFIKRPRLGTWANIDFDSIGPEHVWKPMEFSALRRRSRLSAEIVANVS